MSRRWRWTFQHGHSAWREDGNYSPQLNSETLAPVLRELAPGAEFVVGMSLGGLTAIRLAAMAPDLVGGRLILGIGSGWKQKDYDEYGYRFGTAGSRLDDLAAALPRIKARLGKLNPPPTRDIPVLIGGGGERKTLRLVAEYADIWHSFTAGDSYLAKSAVLSTHCSTVGRNPATIERSAAVDGGGLIASAEALAGLGVTLLTVGCDGPDYDLSAAAALCRWRDGR